MRVVAVILVIIGILAIVGLIYAWSGYYNVAATVPHYRVTNWFLHEARERSILHHSQGVRIPQIKEDRVLSDGFVHFHEMCRLCHGAPGYKETEITKGLYPAPPDLADRELQAELKDAHIFWVVENGLKLTGMPAFGPTHKPEEIAAIVGFVRRLPKITAEQYKALAAKAGGAEKRPGDHHD